MFCCDKRGNLKRVSNCFSETFPDRPRSDALPQCLFITLTPASVVLNLQFFPVPKPPVPPRPTPSIDPDDFEASGLAGLWTPVGAGLADADDLQALRAQVAQALDRERAWRAVLDTARDLTVLREPARVLQAIVERGRALLGSHVAWIAGPENSQDDTLIVRAIDGVSTEWAQQMRAPQGRGAAGYVRRTRSPFATADYFAEDRVTHDARIDATLRSEGVQSMVAVPLLSGAEFLGVLVVADRSAREYTHPDIATLVMLAAHAVVAVRNAQAFAQTRAALAQAELSNDQLQQKTAALEVAADAHERLTRLVAQGGTLADVCRTLASLLGAVAIVVDAADMLLCSAGPDGAPVMDDALDRLDVAAPASPAAPSPTSGMSLDQWWSGLALHAALDASRLSGRSVPLPGPNGIEGRLAGIVGGTRLLGGILVLSEAPLSDVAIRTVERSALVMAVMLLAPNGPRDTPAGRQDSLLFDLLNPLRAGSADLARTAAAQGVCVSLGCVLALLKAPTEGHAVGLMALLQRLRRQVAPRSMLIAEIDGEIAVLAVRQAPQILRQTLLQALADAPHLTVNGVVSARLTTLAELPTAMASLQRGLALVGVLGQGTSVLMAAELEPYVAAFGAVKLAETTVLSCFVDATIGPLLAHDRARGTWLALSLLTYFDNGHSAKVAAGRLGVHVNTLNNRLATATTLLGPWDPPGRGLALHLALRLAALQTSVAPDQRG
jgi:DNA-binding PucR family transcriptional regulator